jgi:hypothetical protein
MLFRSFVELEKNPMIINTRMVDGLFKRLSQRIEIPLKWTWVENAAIQEHNH